MRHLMQRAVMQLSRRGHGQELVADAAKRRPDVKLLAWDDIDRATAAWQVADGAPGSPWDEFRGRCLPLPDWFDFSLDPLSVRYLHQQDRLWRMMVGETVEYAPRSHELTNDQYPDSRHIRVQPGLYSQPSSSSAGDHLIAMGHLVKYSDISIGDRILEYGAGFGQIALTFARRGAIVDTVDIDPVFCAAVDEQAKWFGVPLTPHLGEFGDNPAGGQYKLIIFYEAFHHARDFFGLVQRLRELVAPNGKIMMAGEPIGSRTDPQFVAHVPYPWGIRLDAEVAAVVRSRRWYELGFTEEFILGYFFSMGFVYRKRPGMISHYANIYEFLPRPVSINLSEWRLPPDDDYTWHDPEPNGRWSKSRSTITLDRASDWSALRVDLSNFHPKKQTFRLEIDHNSIDLSLFPGERKQFDFRREDGKGPLIIVCEPISPRSYGADDNRELGIFCHSITYL
jgi:2-polyprenyl-3-methyl-5-hydroxy-6-metoxy-1,4-benzoquinol methylase